MAVVSPRLSGAAPSCHDPCSMDVRTAPAFFPRWFTRSRSMVFQRIQGRVSFEQMPVESWIVHNDVLHLPPHAASVAREADSGQGRTR